MSLHRKKRFRHWLDPNMPQPPQKPESWHAERDSGLVWNSARKAWDPLAQRKYEIRRFFSGLDAQPHECRMLFHIFNFSVRKHGYNVLALKAALPGYWETAPPEARALWARNRKIAYTDDEL